MAENKYFRSESVYLNRSQIKLAEYNPRTISEEGKKQLKRSIKRYGVVGGIVVNKQTGNTVVGGHQKIKILDEINKYPANDYQLRVELVDLDEKTEKELNITLNNPNVGGDWDYDALRDLVPDIDYKEAGLTDADLSMIGVDIYFQTEGQDSISSELDELMQPEAEQRQKDNERRKLEREADRLLQQQEKEPEREKTPEEKKQAVKEMKKQIMDAAVDKANDMQAYIVLSFDNHANKTEFCSEFDISPYDKYIKGEEFLRKLLGE